jgi:competence protein ComGF
MLIKYSNASKLDTNKRIEANKYGLYPVLYGSYATYAEADKAKKIQKRTIQKPGF